jgi:acyl-CoA synthetase (AMP-forming)/AMP-acid ligase II
VPEYRGLAMAEMLEANRRELPTLREAVSFVDWQEFCASGSPTRALPTVDPDALFAYCRERLAKHEVPRHWVIVDEFPLTPSGKAQKYVLREWFLAEAARASTADQT